VSAPEQEESYSLRVLERVGEIPESTWNALVGEESSPFVEHAWLDALEETGCVGPETGWQPAHLSLWRGETLVAVAPSYVKGNSEGEFVFDWSWAEASHRMGIPYYPKAIVAVPFTPATGDRVLVAPGEDRARATRLVASAAREWCNRFGGSGVHVLFPREEEAREWEASGYMRRDGIQYQWLREGAKTFDDYLARFDSKRRNQIRRELRRVQEDGITVETLTPEGHTREVARAMHGFYASTVERHGPWGRLYLTEAFFERVTERFRDHLAWVVARETRSGELVGGAFNVTKGARMYGRYWGARVDVPNLHFVICYYEGARACIERGIDVFEGGAGRDEHKRARGFRPALTHSAHWVKDRRLRSALGPWLAHERERVKELLTEP
jgi:predicted N-acyltransferase